MGCTVLWPCVSKGNPRIVGMQAPDPTAQATTATKSARACALQALCIGDPAAKLAAVQKLRQGLEAAGPAPSAWIDPTETCEPDPASPLPGRPARPELIAPGRVAQRSPFTPEGLAALVHAIAHIEFNAINLALDAVWRFPEMPESYYRDWLRVACEEASHFALLSEHLNRLGHCYGDFPAHDGLWEMCVKTQDDITARMALVPRTLEARGLDATPLIQARLRKVNTPHAERAVEILDQILRDEIGHVAVGNRWYGWLCAAQGLDPITHYRTLARQHAAPRLRPPFNTEARRAAGFNQKELDELQAP